MSLSGRYPFNTAFFTRAKDTIISEIISTQSLDVPTVSGATFSSNSILNAVADALGTGSPRAEQPADNESNSGTDQPGNGSGNGQSAEQPGNHGGNGRGAGQPGNGSGNGQGTEQPGSGGGNVQGAGQPGNGSGNGQGQTGGGRHGNGWRGDSGGGHRGRGN